MSRSGKRVTLGFLAIVIIGFIAGVRIAHPHEGLSNGLGSAQSGLVLYRTGEVKAVGSKVIVDFSGSHPKPVLAVITGNQKSSITVQTGSKLEEVSPNQIKGRLLVMVPFLGQLLNVIGL